MLYAYPTHKIICLLKHVFAWIQYDMDIRKQNTHEKIYIFNSLTNDCNCHWHNCCVDGSYIFILIL
jgi:hypothetical protein